jgi:hypothetical protein
MIDEPAESIKFDPVGIEILNRAKVDLRATMIISE